MLKTSNYLTNKWANCKLKYSLLRGQAYMGCTSYSDLNTVTGFI